MTEISFTVEGVPVAKARARAGLNGHYTPAKTRDAERLVGIEARAAMIAARQTMFTGPVELALAFYFPVPKSWPGWKREKALRFMAWKISKPDVDNLAKLVKDACNGIVWSDDAQVAVISRITKQYDETARTEVTVRPLDDWLVRD